VIALYPEFIDKFIYLLLYFFVMPVNIPVHESTPQIKYRGLCDFQGLLSAMRQWIVDQGYTFNEFEYKYKPAEHEIGWNGTRNLTNFFQFQVIVYFHVWDYKDVEVVKDGKKTTLQNVRMLIEITGTLVVDYKGLFEKTSFLLAIRDFLMKYVWRKKITGGLGDELYYITYKLHRLTKEHLNMETKTDSSRYRYP